MEPVTILVVEDDLPIRESLCELLTFEGYSVEAASHGLEALSKLKNIGKPRLILLDLMMPVMTGWEFLEQIRNDNAYSSVPVVILSAVGNTSKEGLANGFLKKPIEMDSLLAQIKKFCD